LDFSDQALKEAKSALNGFYDLFGRLTESEDKAIADPDLDLAIARCQAGFRAAMDDDLNTPAAIAALQGLRSDVNKLMGHSLSTGGRRRAREEFLSLGNNLGLFHLDLDKKWQFKEEIVGTGAVRAGASTVTGTGIVFTPLSDSVIETRVAERNEARRKKDFMKADEIRKELAAQGIIIEDKPDGTSRWKR
jgi:cysteinyl-tRNA synthetase